MNTQHAVNDNLDHMSTEASDTRFQSGPSPAEQAVIAAAILAATAFRLRDEEALITTMRRLAQAVANLDSASAA